MSIAPTATAPLSGTVRNGRRSGAAPLADLPLADLAGRDRHGGRLRLEARGEERRDVQRQRLFVDQPVEQHPVIADVRMPVRKCPQAFR